MVLPALLALKEAKVRQVLLVSRVPDLQDQLVLQEFKARQVYLLLALLVQQVRQVLRAALDQPGLLAQMAVLDLQASPDRLVRQVRKDRQVHRDRRDLQASPALGRRVLKDQRVPPAFPSQVQPGRKEHKEHKGQLDLQAYLSQVQRGQQVLRVRMVQLDLLDLPVRMDLPALRVPPALDLLVPPDLLVQTDQQAQRGRQVQVQPAHRDRPGRQVQAVVCRP